MPASANACNDGEIAVPWLRIVGAPRRWWSLLPAKQGWRNDPRRLAIPAGAYEAYERALEEGRAMLASPYSASGQTLQGTTAERLSGHDSCGSCGGGQGGRVAHVGAFGNFPASAVPGSAGGFHGSAADPRLQGFELMTKNPKGRGAPNAVGRVRNPIAETTSKPESAEQARERFQTVTAGHYGAPLLERGSHPSVGSSPYGSPYHSGSPYGGGSPISRRPYSPTNMGSAMVTVGGAHNGRA